MRVYRFGGVCPVCMAKNFSRCRRSALPIQMDEHLFMCKGCGVVYAVRYMEPLEMDRCGTRISPNKAVFLCWEEIVLKLRGERNSLLAKNKKLLEEVAELRSCNEHCNGYCNSSNEGLSMDSGGLFI